MDLKLPKISKELDIYFNFSVAESTLLKLGYNSDADDSRWVLIFFENALWFLRSWTGNTIYVMKFDEISEGMTASKLIVNRDPTQFNNSDDSYDIEMANYLIKSLIFKLDTDFPLSGNVNSPEAMLIGKWQNGYFSKKK